MTHVPTHCLSIDVQLLPKLNPLSSPTNPASIRWHGYLLQSRPLFTFAQSFISFIIFWSNTEDTPDCGFQVTSPNGLLV